MRKRREGEVVCWCGSYNFPHRLMGGSCNGACFVRDYFEQQLQDGCRDCALREETTYDEYKIECQALEGLEPALQCPALQEHIRYHGVKLYGVNR
jgi:hypothetical protein